MKTRQNLNNFLVMLVFLLATLCTAATGGTILVPGDYSKIQDAINAAANGDQIEVAPGTYDETINFKGKAVRLYSSGGAAATTIDGGGAGTVVKCLSGEGAGTILEGFTITGGSAAYYGGGMYNRNDSSPTVTNCTFTDNSAGYHGGGMGNDNSSPTVTNCKFTGNSPTWSGGGMYNANSSSPTVTNCTFSGKAAYSGGGIFNSGSSPTVTDCTFSDNSVRGYGGGIYNYDSSSPNVSNCTFSGNTAPNGGGMCNDAFCYPTVANCTFTGNSASASTSSYGGGMCNYSSSPTVTGCTFTDNYAENAGGGMYNSISSSPTVTDCTFTSNSTPKTGGGMYNQSGSDCTVTNCTFTGNSTAFGGGMYNYDCNPTVVNCTFSDNVASTAGGGMRNNNCSPTLVNCTFSGNSAGSGGGMSSWNNSSPTATNCILWADTPDEITGGTPTITYSDVKDGTGQPWFGTGCIDADPFFAGADDLRLSPWSPCINAGDNSAVTVDTDLNGKPRIFNDTVDMGAYECMSDPENTPPGQDVEVSDTETGTTMSFDTVDSGGDTTVTITQQGQDPPPPTGFKLVPLGMYYKIDTTAEFTGIVHIAIEYDDTELTTGQEMALKLRCYEESTDEWVDITTDLDTLNNIIYGETNHLSLFAITTDILVEIDIKPGSYPNAINLGSQGVIPVAILSSSDFDATTVNPDTVELAGAGVAMRGKGDKYLAHEEDVNGDGLLDLVCKVETENLDPDAFQYGFVNLTGETYDGASIKGEDEIIIVPPEE